MDSSSHFSHIFPASTPKENELSTIFSKNRERLVEHFSPGDVILVKGEGERFRNPNAEFPFRQDSNFFYLTGIEFPDCSLIIVVHPTNTSAENRDKFSAHLFVPNDDPQFPVWHGTPKKLEEWTEQYKLTSTMYARGMEEFLGELKATNKMTNCFALVGKFLDIPDFNSEVNSKKLEAALFDSRAVKNSGEIQIMKEAARISALGHIEVMKKCKPGLFEYQLESIFCFFCSYNGCRAQAYRTIVGTGKNGSILHYSANSKKIEDGELVVIDAGCELFCYASDITRTFPANGKFTENQKLIYEIVLKAQKKLISEVVPGLEFTKLASNAKMYLLEGLIKANFITCSVEEALKENLLSLFMPHGLGHLLGLDVHDTSIYPVTPLKSGMIITIEPGIYFNHALIDKFVADTTKNKFLNLDKLQEFRNFGGVRIEDDILVTENGCACLTDVPKEIHEIEKIMAN